MSEAKNSFSLKFISLKRVIFDSLSWGSTWVNLYSDAVQKDFKLIFLTEIGV